MTFDDGGFSAAMLVLVALVGLAVGSFVNVLVWRLPLKKSLVRPPSACPRCKHVIRRRDNVPVLSWLVLRGRCRDCHEPISARYPLVELATGGLFVLVAGRFGFEAPLVWALPAYAYLAAIGVALAMIDIDTHTLPDRIVLPSYGVAIALLLLATAGGGDWGAMLRALEGGAILWVFYFILVLAYPRGMGFGDVKLAGVLGLYLGWLGWGELVVGAFAAFLLGGIFSIALLALRRVGRKSGIPFGPWMLGGAALGIAAGGALWADYLDAVL